SKHLHDVAAAFMAAKKARLKAVTVSMSRGSTALIATPSPPSASLAAAVVVAASC
ncbi:hypothetical protein BDFG_07218, partial [Blastomyces dermatitidis ATCC 26199]